MSKNKKKRTEDKLCYRCREQLRKNALVCSNCDRYQKGFRKYLYNQSIISIVGAATAIVAASLAVKERVDIDDAEKRINKVEMAVNENSAAALFYQISLLAGALEKDVDDMRGRLTLRATGLINGPSYRDALKSARKNSLQLILRSNDAINRFPNDERSKAAVLGTCFDTLLAYKTMIDNKYNREEWFDFVTVKESKHRKTSDGNIESYSVDVSGKDFLNRYCGSSLNGMPHVNK